jgi:RNA polymerase sigma-70 factor (ECF subfamily)
MRRVGDLLDAYRPYLLAVAMNELPEALAGKIGASDVVQETLLKGYEHFAAFRGHTAEELVGWLRQILINHLANVVRQYDTKQRKVDREEQANSGLADPCTDSPSSDALTREEWDLLHAALGNLPDETRQAILLRHRENKTFAEIGAALNKSEEAARKIWARGIEKLQKELGRHWEPE